MQVEIHHKTVPIKVAATYDGKMLCETLGLAGNQCCKPCPKCLIVKEDLLTVD